MSIAAARSGWAAAYGPLARIGGRCVPRRVVAVDRLFPVPGGRVPGAAGSGQYRINEGSDIPGELVECRPGKLVRSGHFAVRRYPACGRVWQRWR